MINPPETLSMYWNYLEAVREALEQPPHAWTFKSDKRYREVLEHTPTLFAQAMLEWSQAALPGLSMDYVKGLCHLNDSLGKPEQVPIRGLGTYSTSNMKYLCHAIKVWQHIDSLGMEQVHIYEIGAGYGGLALWVDGLRPYFRTEHVTYTSFDLPDVAQLQNRYAEALDVSLYARDQAWVSTHDAPDSRFCISIYAFSEFDQLTRDWYVDRVMRHCRHGLIIWNFAENQCMGLDGRLFGGPVYKFVDWPITRVLDEPRLYAWHEMVTW